MVDMLENANLSKSSKISWIISNRRNCSKGTEYRDEE